LNSPNASLAKANYASKLIGALNSIRDNLKDTRRRFVIVRINLVNKVTFIMCFDKIIYVPKIITFSYNTHELSFDTFVENL